MRDISSAAPAHDSRAAEPHGVPVSHLVRALGPIIRAVAGPPGDGDPVIAAADVYEPDATDRDTCGLLLLGVGIDVDLLDAALLDRLSARGVPALMVKGAGTPPPAVRDDLNRSGITLLVVDRSASWFHVSGLVRERLETGHLRSASFDQGSGLPRDLFGVANAVSDLVDAPVTIEDRDLRVLAFSRHHQDTDPGRAATVLGQAVPERYRRLLAEQHVIERLHASAGPLYLEFGPELTPRLAMAVRSGEEILGSMWAAVPGPVPEHRTRAFAEAAPVVALALLRRRTESDAGRRLREELLVTLISGDPDAQEARSRLGLAGRPARVLAVMLPQDDRPGSEQDGIRGADAFNLHLSSVHPSAAAALVGSTLYGVVPTLPGQSGTDHIRRVASDFAHRFGKPGVRVGIGRTAGVSESLVPSRRDADRALRALQMTESPESVATGDDVFLSSMLLQMKDFADIEGITVPSGPVATLVAYDTEHETELLHTLETYLEFLGDVAAAAERLHVHPNTLRYRVRRIGELAGLDLGSSEDILAAWIQIRLHRLPTPGSD